MMRVPARPTHAPAFRDKLSSMKTITRSAIVARRRSVCLVEVVCSVMLASAPLAAQQGDVHRDVPYVPTPPDVVEAMLKLGDVKKGDVLYDQIGRASCRERA